MAMNVMIIPHEFRFMASTLLVSNVYVGGVCKGMFNKWNIQIF